MDKMMMSATRWMLCLIVIAAILYFFVPTWKSVALGLMIGFVASTLNAFLLHRRVVMVTEPELQQQGKRKRRKSLGFGNRIAMVLLVAMLGYRYPEIINLPAALSASMVMPFLILIAAIFHTMKENNGGKG